MKKIKREISLKELKDTVIMDRHEYHKLIYETINTNKQISDIRSLFYDFKRYEIEREEFINEIQRILNW